MSTHYKCDVKGCDKEADPRVVDLSIRLWPLVDPHGKSMHGCFLDLGRDLCKDHLKMLVEAIATVYGEDNWETLITA